MGAIIRLLKKLPIDLGQADNKHNTKGKQIALNLIGGQQKNGAAALDVGCRDGYYSKILEQRGFSVTSIDIEKSYKLCQIIDADKILPFSDNQFDLIWCSEVIEHLKDPHASMKEFRRILKPNGRAIFTTPNSVFWLYKILKLVGLTPQKVQNPTHRQFFSINDILSFGPDVVYGFFPYAVVRLTIKNKLLINMLSPTFIFQISKK